jgi:galactoside O-acetyltransferase
MNSFLSREELENIGFGSIGEEVYISRHSSIYSPQNIHIGNHVRIDDFCILSGSIIIGNYIHIASYTALYGGVSGIKIDDFSNLSSRICVYAVSDDYSGESMTNPMIPDKYRHVKNEPVHIKKHCILGSGCTVLPGVILGEGSAFGCMTLIKKSTEPWGIYVGIPANRIKDRSKALLKFEQDLTCNLQNLGC